ncbi:hypothetical protein Tco_0001143 [Tanacetum coccineum]
MGGKSEGKRGGGMVRRRWKEGKEEKWNIMGSGKGRREERRREEKAPATLGEDTVMGGGGGGAGLWGKKGECGWGWEGKKIEEWRETGKKKCGRGKKKGGKGGGRGRRERG